MKLLFLYLFLVGSDPYELEVQKARKSRIENLKGESGWLNLAGLFWLKEGKSSIGGASKNDFEFPKEHANPFLGQVILRKGVVSYWPQGAKKAHEIFPAGGTAVVESHQSLRWFIIKRGDKYAIRLRDLEGEYLKAFKEIAYYPISAASRVKAKFIPTQGQKLRIIDITGRSYEEDSPGKLVFLWEGKEYSLSAGGTLQELFIVFGDMTNQQDTYGGGRFLDSPGPDAEGYVYLDFNLAYNPPCAFTPFATCPLPTRENKLPIAIRAGEKSTGLLGHR